MLRILIRRLLPPRPRTRVASSLEPEKIGEAACSHTSTRRLSGLPSWRYFHTPRYTWNKTQA